MTALMVACQEGHLDIVKFLIRREADVNAQNNVSHRNEVCRHDVEMDMILHVVLTVPRIKLCLLC